MAGNLPDGRGRSGLLAVRSVLEDIEGLVFVELGSGDVVRLKLAGQIAKSGEILERSATQRRKFLARSHNRHETTSPTTAAPELICPGCDQPLLYRRSHIGGVSERHPEQWDDFVCASCGAFHYRHRTRKLRRA